MYVKCSRLYCSQQKKIDDEIKLWRKSNNGMFWVHNVLKLEKDQFGIVGVQVAGNRTYNALAFMDDITLIGGTKEKAETLLDICHSFYKINDIVLFPNLYEFLQEEKKNDVNINKYFWIIIQKFENVPPFVQRKYITTVNESGTENVNLCKRVFPVIAIIGIGSTLVPIAQDLKVLSDEIKKLRPI
ncbi:hypothetical protein GLOIN_2v1873217 [Rhizophagus clarus]|uniref:Uncharacterized protein n=1 Tax=Rhizophagus clarus TaxID=94130 RepID=A0A8H3LP19_9GLOM|nr:hypothetical protein GLOIN_2v1873217 [Rhizophagus clarus]